MKIGIIGNMNNAYFSLARYLRDEGYDCELLIIANEPDHFDPSCDTDSIAYKSFCRYVSWGDPGDFLKTDFGQVKRDLATYDFLIGSGASPAYLARLNRKLDVFVPYGYDLYSLPFLRLVHPVRQLAYATVSYYQRRGIRQCGSVLFDRTNPAFEKRIARLKFSHKRIVAPLPMLYHHDYNPNTGDVPQVDESLSLLRRENDLVIVQQGRQSWKNSSDIWSFKGNHHLLQGYCRFVSEVPKCRSRLVLFEYGDDVHESKKLIAQLGISERVTWLPRMPRKELMKVLAMSDLVVGELHHSWHTYGVMMEALYLGKAFLHNRNDAEYRPDYPEMYPMLHAHSAETVFQALNTVATDRSLLKTLGEGGRHWFFSYCVNLPVSAIVHRVEERKSQTACLKAS